MVEKRSKPGSTNVVNMAAPTIDTDYISSAMSGSDSELTDSDEQSEAGSEPGSIKIQKRKTKADTAGIEKLEKKEMKTKKIPKRKNKADTAKDFDRYAGMTKEEKKKLKQERKDKREKKRAKKAARKSQAAEEQEENVKESMIDPATG